MSIREGRIMLKNPIYWFCMVVFPLLVLVFFTSMMQEGLPTDMPMAVVDNDNTSTTRKLTRMLDGFQSSRVVAHYPSVADARKAMQRNEIYAFLYLPEGITDKLLAGRQPKISFYYNLTSIMSGSLLYKDLKTISTLAGAAVGKAQLSAHGATDEQIMTFLQPIRIDLHQPSNPWTNYNIYLSTVMVPGVLMLFIFLITAYSIGTELKFQRSRQLMSMAGNNIVVAMIGKFLPQSLIHITIVLIFMFYCFGVLEFPHPGGTWKLFVLAAMLVAAAQGFGIFVFGLMPSLRMSMSVCSLWAVLSFSIVGAAYPVMGMDPELQSLSWLFPLRHYYMVYQITVFNGFPFIDTWFHFAMLLAFALMPLMVLPKIKNAMLKYVYIP